MGTYVFTKEGELERLCLQARVWEPAAEQMLDRIGIRPGSRCVDLGCGPMGILGPLDRRARPGGKVIGIEALAANVAAAREYSSREGLQTVEVIEGDIYDPRLPRESFDLVHGRFILAPLGRADDVLREGMALLRPGGVFASQEPDQNSWEYFPKREVWGRVKAMLEVVFPRFGGDANAGQRTFELLRRHGFEDVRVSAAVVALQDRHEYMRTPIVGLMAMRRFIVEAGLMTEGELDATLAELDRIVDDPQTYSTTFTLTQVWGRKPRVT